MGSKRFTSSFGESLPVIGTVLGGVAAAGAALIGMPSPGYDGFLAISGPAWTVAFLGLLLASVSIAEVERRGQARLALAESVLADGNRAGVA